MKKPVVIIVALSLAAAIVMGVFYRRDLTQRREIDAAMADLESNNQVRVKAAIKMLSESQDHYAARRLAESLVTYGSGTFSRKAVVTAIEKSGKRGLSAILDVLTADPRRLPEERRLEGVRRLWFMNDVKTIVRAMGGEATGALVTLARHNTAEGREAAAELLAETADPSATPALIDLLEDKVEWVRLTAIKALGVLKPPEAVGALAEVMQRDRSCAYEAARALGKSGHAEARDFLVAALSHSDAAVRAAAVQGVRRLSPPDPRAVGPLIELVRNAIPPVRSAAVSALLFTNDPRVYDLMLEFLDDPTMRGTAIGFLGRHGDQSIVERLASRYEGAEEPERRSIAKALARLDPPRGVPLVVKLINEGEGFSRYWTFMMLTEIEHPVVAETMIEFLTTGDTELRKWAAHNVGAQRDERAIGPLLEALEDTSLRSVALRSLAYFPTLEVIARIAELYDSFDARAQFHAVSQLGRMGTPESLLAARKLAGDELAEVAKNYKAIIATGSEEDLRSLVAALWLYGTLEMAIDYAWCMEPLEILAKRASEWAKARDCSDVLSASQDSTARPKWGSAESGE